MEQKRLERITSAGLIAVSLLLYLFLVDCSVETYKNAGPLRWWGVAASIGITFVVILLWRRLSWPVKCFVLLASSLALLTAAAWTPGGLENGVRALGLNTAQLYQALFGLLVVLSAALVLPWKQLSAETRVVSGLLFLYALTPFVIAFSTRQPSFRSLFQGESFWSALPIYLQGAYISLGLAFPAALLRLAVDLPRTAREKRLLGPASAALALCSGILIAAQPVSRLDLLAPVPGIGDPSAPLQSTLSGDSTPPLTTTVPPATPTPPPPSRAATISDTAPPPSASLEAPSTGTPPTSDAEPEGTPFVEVQFSPAPPREDAPTLKRNEFFDVEPRINAELTFFTEKRTPAQLRWLAIDAGGIERELGRNTVRGARGDRVAAALEAPPAGFPAGEYRLDVTPPKGDTVSAAFSIRRLYPDGTQEAPVSDGFDIAVAALGGRIEFASSESGTQGAAVNLINRNLQYWDCQRCGWISEQADSPQEVVFSFHQQRTARISTVIIDNTTEAASRYNDLDSLPKYIEVFSSTTGPGDGYAKLGAARLPQKLGRFPISFPPTPAAFIKLRFISNYGGKRIRVASVAIIEDAERGSSILSDLTPNIARPELGGSVVRGNGALGPLIDNDVKEYWRSKDSYFPQRLYFAFRNDQEALVDKIVIRQAPSSNPAQWPRRILVSLSSVSPVAGFEEIGEFPLAQSPLPQTLPIGKRARYVQLAITENYGGSVTTLGEVEILEGAAPGYRSVLARNGIDIVSATTMQQGQPIDDPNPAEETEPNDFPAQATTLELGKYTRGAINPLGESDYLKLVLPASEANAFSLSLIGRPTLRTSLEVIENGDTRVAMFDPSKEAADRVDLTFTVQSGEYLLRLTQPPASVVLVWDTSGSMAGRSNDLRAAVEGFIAQIRQTERLQLVPFAQSPRTLLPDFSNDKAVLTGAVASQFHPDGGTAIFDAVTTALKMLEGTQGNRAILLMTDGADTSSRTAYDELWNLLEKNRVRLYTIGLGASMRQFNEPIGSSGERMLAHFALATGGRYFYAEGSQELAGFYREISDELQSTSEYYVRPSVSRGIGTLKVESVGEKIEQMTTPEFELILDASGSMREQKNLVNGRLKIDVAKEVMAGIIRELPNDAVAALRVFGHRIKEGQKGDCEDSQLMAPMGRIDKPRLARAIAGLNALGTTPLGYSLRQAALDFSDGTRSKIIILVTDGKEECGDTPADAVRALRDQGLEVRVNVVGFDLAEESVKNQMREVATMTGGRFFDAQGAAGLKGSVEQALAVPFDVLDSAGRVAQTGAIGHAPLALPEGIYTILIRTRGEPVRVPHVAIVKDRITSVALKKEGAEVGMQVRTE